MTAETRGVAPFSQSESQRGRLWAPGVRNPSTMIHWCLTSASSADTKDSRVTGHCSGLLCDPQTGPGCDVSAGETRLLASDWVWTSVCAGQNVEVDVGVDVEEYLMLC